MFVSVVDFEDQENRPPTKIVLCKRQMILFHAYQAPFPLGGVANFGPCCNVVNFLARRHPFGTDLILPIAIIIVPQTTACTIALWLEPLATWDCHRLHQFMYSVVLPVLPRLWDLTSAVS